MAKRWYVVHAYSGFEHQVSRSLKERILRADMQEKFGDVLVPQSNPTIGDRLSAQGPAVGVEDASTASARS